MEHPNRQIDDGDLLAYLDGKRLPYVRQALRHSPELRERLRQLLRCQQHLQRLFYELPKPEAPGTD